MTVPLHFCRHCDGLITDPEDAVRVACEHGMSGPGRTVWAHREHAHLVRPDLAPLLLLARIRARKAGRQ